MRTTSRQKYDSTATSVPICSTAENAAPGSFQPNSAGTMRRWAVLLIGMNSVSPCTIARTMISSQLMLDRFTKRQIRVVIV